MPEATIAHVSASAAPPRPSGRGALDARTLLILGSGVLALGGLGDLLYHALPPAALAPMALLLGPDGATAHLITFAGMAVALLGVVVRGLRS